MAEAVTYFLEGEPIELEELKKLEGVVSFKQQRCRAVMETTGQAPPKRLIRHRFKTPSPGTAQGYLDAVANRLVELQTLHIDGAPWPASKVQHAEAQWSEVRGILDELNREMRKLKAEYREKRGELQAAIDAAKRDARAAAEDVILTQGTMAEIGGVAYDAAIARDGETVYLIPREKKPRSKATPS